MGLILKKTIFAFVLFITIPLMAINWHWQPNISTTLSYYLLLITETVSLPFAGFIMLFLFILFSFFLAMKCITKIILFWLILFLSLFTGQLIKTVIKETTKEPRPYISAIEKQTNQNNFYALPESEQNSLITEFANQNSRPSWLTKYWQQEVSYALPSGHTIFTATFAFLALLFLGFKRHPITISLTILWSLLIEVSRLALGMHSPKDLILATFIAWLMSVIAYFCIKKWHLIE
ncbi:phosphatase PAP2 family protein [Orbaceae bacterium ESL0721]|nr:phosphatase PAP2 family protein [Orbaceae bacterium ESL0721]